LSGEWVESAKEEKNLATKIFCFSLAMGHGYYWLGLNHFSCSVINDMGRKSKTK
jgi:hypothetical protein